MVNLTIEIEADICDSYQRGESFPSLEARYKLFYTDINNVLTKHGIPHREIGQLKKLLVGQENEVVAEYHKGYSLRKLALKYHVDRDVISRILEENGVVKRSIKDANKKKPIDTAKIIKMRENGQSMPDIAEAMGLSIGTIHRQLVLHGGHVSQKCKRRSQSISEQMYTEIINLYEKEKWSLCRILKHFGLKIGHAALSKYLRQRGVTIRSGKIQNKRYFCNDNYFSDPHSPAKYWIIGFIATDGYINEGRNSLTFEIGEEDIATLEFIKKELEYTGAIRKNFKKKSVTLNIQSDQIVADLVKLGLHQRKSLTLKPMRWIEDDLFPHFLNGFISGDGWISCYRRYPKSLTSLSKSLTVSFCGSSDLVPWLADKVSKRWKAPMSYVNNHGCHNYTMCQTEACLSLCEEMFSDAPFVMKRKHDKYLEYIDYKNNLLKK